MELNQINDKLEKLFAKNQNYCVLKAEVAVQTDIPLSDDSVSK